MYITNERSSQVVMYHVPTHVDGFHEVQSTVRRSVKLSQCHCHCYLYDAKELSTLGNKSKQTEPVTQREAGVIAKARR